MRAPGRLVTSIAFPGGANGVTSMTFADGANRVASADTSTAGPSFATGVAIAAASGTVRLHLSANVIGPGWRPGGSAAAITRSSTRNGSMGDGSIGNARNDDTSANAEFSMTHSRCLGVGNGLESANGSATTNTNTPPTTPARRMAQLEIRSAQWAGAFISNRVLSSKRRRLSRAGGQVASQRPERYKRRYQRHKGSGLEGG